METYDSYEPMDSGAFGAIFFVYALVIIFMIVCLWRIFTKAGKPGWAAIIPIYNTIVILEIVGKPVWWFILLLIPFVNIVIGIMVIHRLSVVFGKGVGMTILLIILPIIGYPMLAFGDAKYLGAQAGAHAMT